MDVTVLDKKGVVVKELTSQGKNATLNWELAAREKRLSDASF